MRLGNDRPVDLAKFCGLLVILMLFVSPALVQSVLAANSLGFNDESSHYVVVGQISFDGTAPVAGRFVAIDLNFKPLPASYWNNTVTTLNFTITHTRCVDGSCIDFQGFDAGVTLDTGSGVSWTYTTHQYYPPNPITVGRGAPVGPWYFKPNETGSYQATAVIKLTKPSFPAETYKFSFEVVNQTSSSPTSTTLTTTMISTKTATTTSTVSVMISESPVYLLTSAILTVALGGTIIWVILGKRRR